MGKIVLSDLHGCYNTMLALIEKIKADFPNDEIIIAGDLVDRGPRSRQVVQYCIDNNIKVVKGNHEDMMCTDVLDKPSQWRGGWYELEGVETIKSYCNEEGIVNTELMKIHAEWMNNLPLYLEFTDCKNEENKHLVVSHSSIFDVWHRKDNPDAFFKQQVLWNRDYISSEVRHMNIFNCFGHTPFPDYPRITDCYANIDTGACFNDPHYGIMSAIHFPSMKVIQQKNLDFEGTEYLWET